MAVAVDLGVEVILDQPSSALAAPDTALEVVRVLAVFLPGGVVGGQHGLHLQAGLGVDQCGVAARLANLSACP